MKRPLLILISVLNILAVLLLGSTIGDSQSGLGGGGQSNVGGGGSGGGSSQPGFNVKTLGATGDARVCNSVSTTGGGSSVLTGTCNWTTADVGKQIVLNAADGSFTTWSSSTTISSINSSSSINVSQPNNGGAFTGVAVFGTIADAAFQQAVTSANAQLKGTVGTGNTGTITAPATVYIPAGGYLLGNLALSQIAPNSGNGFAIRGDGPDQTFIYTAGQANGFTGTQNLISVGGSTNNVIMSGFTIDGANNLTNPAAILINGQAHLYDVTIQRWGVHTNGATPAWGLQAQGGIWGNKVVAVNNGGGILCLQCNGEFYESTSSNNGNTSALAVNLVIKNSVGLQNGSGFRWVNGLIDECGSQPSGCTQIINSSDVWLIGGAFFSTSSGQAVNVDGTSFAHMNGGIAGVFGNDSNASGIGVQAGGVVQMSDVRAISTGTGKCINNSGTVNDNGGNSCENMFVITSGTSTGTTAVLTLQTVGAAPNANCSVGDALLVQNASIAGYNGYFPAGATSGITATSATTLTYTTSGSNLGALGAGGVAFCRNLQSFTGTLPRALLNNPIPNTCHYTITPIANATTVTLCNWSTGSATNITRIRASSQVTTTCATAPVITISDGTVSQTLTLTTGKNSWDSAVDASTGVGTTIFKPNGTITVKYDVAATSSCATPATNLSVSYNISPILSN